MCLVSAAEDVCRPNSSLPLAGAKPADTSPTSRVDNTAAHSVTATPALTPSAQQTERRTTMPDTRTQREIEIAADLIAADTTDTDAPF